MSLSPFPETNHDHQDCVRDGLRHAEQICKRDGARLTPLRRRVLELLLQEHRALGAYDIIERIDWQGRRPAPPIVYRALEFLLGQGLVHRIETKKAFFACANPGSRHGAQFLICEDCARVAELDDPKLTRSIARSSASALFLLRASVIEMFGQCADCQGRS